MTPQALLLMLLAALALGVVGVAVYGRGSAQRAEAVRRSRLEVDAGGLQRLRAVADRLLRRLPSLRRLEDRLVASGFDATLTDAVGFVLAVMAAAFVFGAVVVSTIAGVVLAVVALIACDRWVAWRAGKRLEEFIGQLPELARTLSSASSAGLALASAVALAAREVGEPARTVLQSVVDELALGQSIEGALHNLERRMPSREVAVLVTTLVIQQRAGGDTVRALREMSDTLERRKDLRREIRTILSGALATGYTVAVLGAGTLLFMNVIRPGIVARMLEGWAGRIVLLVSFSLFSLGFVLIRRITRIDS